MPLVFTTPPAHDGSYIQFQCDYIRSNSNGGLLFYNNNDTEPIAELTNSLLITREYRNSSVDAPRKYQAIISWKLTAT